MNARLLMLLLAAFAVALVTGAANGIGRAIAERLLSEGARVLALDLEAETVTKAAAELAKRGGEIEPIAGDISRRVDVTRAIERCVERFGGLDVLVANAGIADAQPFLDIEEESWRRIIDVNLTGTFFCIQEAARVMVPRGRGTIIFTGATASLRGGSGFSAFAGAKFALRALAQAMARELGPEGVHVAHTIIDGASDTEWIAKNFPQRYALKEQDGILNPDHIAEAYFMVHSQPRDAWTHELDLRPWIEKMA